MRFRVVVCGVGLGQTLNVAFRRQGQGRDGGRRRQRRSDGRHGWRRRRGKQWRQWHAGLSWEGRSGGEG